MAFYEVIKTFRVRQDGNSIKLSEGQIVSIPGEKAVQLLSTGKIKPCTGDDERFQDTFSRAAGEMAAKYESGFFGRARRQCPERYLRLGRAEDRINRFWDEGDFEGFRRELTEWGDIYRSLLALFRSGNHG